jgi:hypothetical protein
MRARNDDNKSVFHLPTLAPLRVDIGSGFFHAASLEAINVVEPPGSDNRNAAKPGKNIEEFSSLQNRASQGYSGLHVNERNSNDMGASRQDWLGTMPRRWWARTGSPRQMAQVGVTHHLVGTSTGTATHL